MLLFMFFKDRYFSEDQQKLAQEYQEYQKKLEQQKEEYRKEHPDEVNITYILHGLKSPRIFNQNKHFFYKVIFIPQPSSNFSMPFQ